MGYPLVPYGRLVQAVKKVAKSAAERKREQLARENAALAKLGGRRVRFLCYGATLAALEAVCVRQGFSGQQRLGEALTWLVHEEENRHNVSTHEKDEPQ